jgi:hypothetical protein
MESKGQSQSQPVALLHQQAQGPGGCLLCLFHLQGGLGH